MLPPSVIIAEIALFSDSACQKSAKFFEKILIHAQQNKKGCQRLNQELPTASVIM